VTHSFVTIAIPFEVELSDLVEKYLDELGTPLLDDHVTSALSPLQAEGKKGPLRAKLDETQIIHFMSITVVRGDDERSASTRRGQFKTENSFIIIEASVDGGMDRAIDTIAENMTTEFHELLRVANAPDRDMPLAAFLDQYRHDVGQGWFSTRRLRPGVNYDGTPGMTVQRIKQEAELADQIAHMLYKRAPGGSALSVLEDIRAKLWVEGEKWAFVADPAPCLQANKFSKWGVAWGFIKSATSNLLWPFLLLLISPTLIFLLLLAVPELRARWSEYFLVAALFTGLLVVIEALAAAVGYAWLRHLEKTDVCDGIALKAKHVENLMRRETFGAQNHLAASSIMKPGWFRRLTLRVGLWAAGFIAAYGSQPSFLGPTGVIHFARWILLPGTNKLLFMSNYDGAWETYLEDFIEKAHEGVTGIWSNTEGFPRTETLFSKGATDGDRLRRWTRRQQHPSWFWYVAYPKLSMARIRTNAAIRQGIAAARTEADAADWLTCFGSSPRPANSLQLEEISTLVLGGLRRLRSGACLFLRLSSEEGETSEEEKTRKTKQWLARMADEVSYGDHLNASKALVLGFAHSGLQRLGLTKEHLATFPVAFQQGNAAPWRARTLGDIGLDDPKYWLWGAGNQAINQTNTMSAGTEVGKQVDAVMLIYARDPAELPRLEQAQIDQLRRYGGHIVFRIKFKELPEQQPGAPRLPKEPFGFLDGISNPIIRGIRSTKSEDAGHLVDPGEFILGYPDNLGYTPPSPSVAPGDDPEGILPSAGPDLSRQRPDFSEPAATARHDLGMNGAFLVVRQLEQDKAVYDAFLDATVQELTRSGHEPRGISVPLRDWIAAKMLGRWPDGTSLVRHPHNPGTCALSGGLRARPVPPDNDFSFRIEDPNGLRCPFGAHIRRANPRDSFVSGLEKQPDGATKEQVEEQFAEQIKEQLRIVNRHRILRVGRPYEAQECMGAPENGLDKPGLVFMCLNVDIERQFEFLQQSWVLGPSFHGLQNEIDPLVGNRQGSETFSIPTPRGPTLIKDIRDFVRVRGGGYFFLPGKRALRFLAHPEQPDGQGHVDLGPTAADVGAPAIRASPLDTLAQLNS
jgi:deferrochelatase/peroxidase EfeB